MLLIKLRAKRSHLVKKAPPYIADILKVGINMLTIISDIKPCYEIKTSLAEKINENVKR